MSDKENEENKTFEVSVHDSVGLKELHPGGDKPQEEKTQLTREEILQKVLERRVELSKFYVKPHNIVSRHVTNEDIKQVVQDAYMMHEMCLVGRADYNSAHAIAHTQVNDKDPLRFYVTIAGEIIVNPVLFDHTKYFVDKKEGCMSFPEEPMKDIQRFHKVKMRYQTLTYKEKDGKPITQPELSPFVETNYSGEAAEVAQHEVAHLNGSNIYDENHSAMNAIGDKSDEKEGAVDKQDFNSEE